MRLSVESPDPTSYMFKRGPILKILILYIPDFSTAAFVVEFARLVTTVSPYTWHTNINANNVIKNAALVFPIAVKFFPARDFKKWLAQS